MSGGWPPALAFFGLHVDCGRYSYDRLRWTRLPVARFTCRHGCDIEAFGAADVAHLTTHLAEIHARSCPGPHQKESTA